MPVTTRSACRIVALFAVGTALFAEPSLAHAGALSGTLRPVAIPSWLVVVTGGGVIGASFLLTSLVTDHAAIRALNGWHVAVPTRETVRAVGVWVLRGLSIAVLVSVVVSGLFGPQAPVANLAVLVVWAGWWAGYTMTTYLVGNTWPALDPWRTLATYLPTRPNRSYPDRLGVWPSVVGLVLLVWLEVVSPVAQDPRLLAGVVLAYTTVTLAGTAAYGTETWFGTVDPIARVFRWYGHVAPLGRTGSQIEMRLPGAALVETGKTDETPFIVALLWVTTYDGLVSTPAWSGVARAVVESGIPPLVVYLVTAIGGFAGFFYVYELASRWSRRTADSYVTASFIGGWFAPALVPIAVGYHLAHFLGYFVSLLPALFAVVTQPLAPPAAIQTLVLPGWFGAVQLLFVLAGHLLAVWVAHARAFEVFPGRLRPIRSQYPFILVMVLYTMTSLWIVAQPFTPPPYT